MNATSTPATAVGPGPIAEGSGRATVVDVDWKKAAQAAMGSALVAGLITGALYVLNRVVAPDLAGADETPELRGSTPYTPFVYVTEDRDGDDADGDDLTHEENDGSDEVADTDDEPDTTSSADVRRPAFVDSELIEAAAVLGVPVTATAAEIKTAYRNRVRSLHPDLSTDKEEIRRLTEETSRVNRARDLMRKHASGARP